MAEVRNEIVNCSASNESAELSPEDRRRKDIPRILDTLGNNIYGCDLLMSLFYTTLNSYRVQRCLQPFPPGFESNDIDAVEQLRQICVSIPNLRSISINPESLSTETLSLLGWLFTRNDQPRLYLTDLDICHLPNEIRLPLRPNFVFDVVYPKHITEAWNKLKENHNVIVALHGSRLENFYSILSFGLQLNQDERGSQRSLLYGPGIYLSTDFSISVIFAPFSSSWPKSMLGSKLSILALCEVLDVKDKVMRKDASSRSGASLPDKYIVVTDNELVKVKQLLVYSKRETSIRSWLRHNMSLIMLVLYIILLCFIGSHRSIYVGVTKLWNRHLRRYFSHQ